MRLVHFFVLAAVLALSACASSPYPDGVTANDVPAHVNVISYHSPVSYYDDFCKVEDSVNPSSEPTSENMQAVLKVSDDAIRNQLVNYGYKLVDHDQPHDLILKFAVAYIREMAPLINRSETIVGCVYDHDKRQLMEIRHNKAAGGGVLGALINSMITSRDEFVADAARQGTIKLVSEVQKGAKNNVSVEDQHVANLKGEK